MQLEVECTNKEKKVLNLVIDEAKDLQLLPAEGDVDGKPQARDSPRPSPLFFCFLVKIHKAPILACGLCGG